MKIGLDIPTRQKIKLIAAALDGRWRPLILTAIFTGLRASELRNLRWGDVDLDRREVRVHQRADEFGVIGRPKSESGDRTIPVPPKVVQERLGHGSIVMTLDVCGHLFPSTDDGGELAAAGMALLG